MQCSENLINEIYEAFRNVDREGAISWSESVVMDDYGSFLERLAARRRDVDRIWQELAEAEWEPRSGVGGWAFLDPKGCRYYLPAAMIYIIRHGDEWDMSFWLTLDRTDVLHWSGSRWSALDESQRNCVKHFVDYMVQEAQGVDCDEEVWREVLASGWKQLYGKTNGTLPPL